MDLSAIIQNKGITLVRILFTQMSIQYDLLALLVMQALKDIRFMLEKFNFHLLFKVLLVEIFPTNNK